jgi:kynureninase
VSTRERAAELDAQDPLAHLRERHHLPEGLVYLDGNSLGAMPRTAPARLQHTVAHEWGERLIRSWNKSGWYTAPARAAAALAPLLGADADEVVVADSTSVNLAKLLHTALTLRPGRGVIVMERGSFPTDLYVARGVLALRGGGELRLVDGPQDLPGVLDDDVALVSVTEVDFRTGFRWDVGAVTASAHAAGALALVDLCHSTGALDVDVHAWDVDLAVGCGYKFLHGGPGAPAHCYVARRHHAGLPSPTPAWFGHAEPFAMSTGFTPAPGVQRLAGGTPPVLSLTGLLCGLESLEGATPAQLQAKATALTGFFLELLDAHCPELEIATPRDPARRGAHVSVRHPRAYALVQALIARDVVGDFRDPDIARFGLAPTTTRFVDLVTAVEQARAVLDGGEDTQERFAARTAVT